MQTSGYIEARMDCLPALLTAVIDQFASPQTRLALWLIEPFDFAPIQAQPLGAASPLIGSSSELAGLGQLIDFKAVDTPALIAALTAEEALDCQIMHLELEALGSVQFAAYDNFSAIFFGDAVPLDWLDTLKARAIIVDYQCAEP
jgi:hypothetical protein